ncbi:DUF5362 family protein [Paraflavitalea speifideaquila]|uniref:DUF5362 family protein n=1 Tax=Paraflavitalea speifideaquila TaxID=3076558 RepID=UPI0028EB1AA3|nr:DUF5362 family protein [Paraflavitalea speifideiaquila]
MEQQPSNEPLLELEVDYDSAEKFNEASKWAKFIAIICFIGIGIGILLLAVSSAYLLQALSTIMPQLATVGGLAITVIIVVLILYTYITILLYQAATLLKQGIRTQDQAVFNDGLKNLKNYFLITGVLGVLGLVYKVVTLIQTLF